MTIQVLYFDGCPHVEATLELVHDLVASYRPAATIERIHVGSGRDAVERRFLGSPTVRVDGIDVDPTARDRTDFGVSCRIYGASRFPTREMLLSAIGERAPA